MSETKSAGAKERFPKFRKELLRMVEEDQKEIRKNFHAYSKIKAEDIKRRKYALVAKNCHARAHRMLEILGEIKDPTIENIGLDGSKAVSLLALHSYLDIMKKVLAIFEAYFEKDPSNIYHQSIPPLKDRIMILEHKKQLFGTNWNMDRNEKPFLITVEDFSKMNNRRSNYGLKPARHPVNLAIGAIKYPLGRGLAKESDQKPLTPEEYDEYSQYSLKSEL